MLTALIEKRQLKQEEQPGEILYRWKGDGRLKFFFLTKEGLPLPENAWVRAAGPAVRPLSSSMSGSGSALQLPDPASRNSVQRDLPPMSYSNSSGSINVPAGGGGNGQAGAAMSSSPQNGSLLSSMGAGSTPPPLQSSGSVSSGLLGQLDSLSMADRTSNAKTHMLIGLRERVKTRLETLSTEASRLKHQQAAAAAAASVSAAGASPAVSSSPTKASPLAPAAAPTPVPTPVSAPVAAAASSPAGRLTEDFNLEAFATVSFPDLRFGKKIGEGQYGVVSKGTYFDTTVAIKQLLEVEGETFEQTLKYIKRELHALMELRHPNIVQFMGYGVQAQTVFIVTEFIDGGDLHLLLKTLSIELPWHLRIAMAADVARAMCFLHALNWVHRDLKTENLLVDRNGKLKICDLGLARKLNPQKPDQAFARPHAMTVCGTNEFMSPEMILGMPYERNTDVFSFGVIMGEVLTRKEPKEREPEIGYQIDWPEIKQLIPPDWYVSECQCQCQCQRQ